MSFSSYCLPLSLPTPVKRYRSPVGYACSAPAADQKIALPGKNAVMAATHVSTLSSQSLGRRNCRGLFLRFLLSVFFITCLPVSLQADRKQTAVPCASACFSSLINGYFQAKRPDFGLPLEPFYYMAWGCFCQPAAIHEK